MLTTPLQVSQFLDIQSRKEFGPGTRKRFEACQENKYPICLQEALIENYGTGWKKKTVVDADRVVTSVESKSPRRIWKLYVRNVSNWEKNLGEDETHEIESRALKIMDSMQCERCPMYEFELGRLGRS